MMRLWDNDEWANLPIRGSDLAEMLKAAGFTVLGVTNGKPELQEALNAEEIQLIVKQLISGEASLTPSPILTEAKSSKKSKRK